MHVRLSLRDLARPGHRARAAGSSVAAILLALLAGAVLIKVARGDPVAAYAAMWWGAVGSPFGLGQVLTQATPLVIIGLGLAFAFRGRVYNIGAEGQLYVGALSGGTIALLLHTGGPVLVLPLALGAGALGGAAWGGIVGGLRAAWGVNEVISSLLLDYVAIFAFSYAIRVPLRDPTASFLASSTLSESARLPVLPLLFVHAGLAACILLVPLAAYVIRRTPFGFRVGMMGLNPEAARLAGVPWGRMVMWLMLLSGALAGLAGVIQVLGVTGRLELGISQGYGFTAIVVALLGRLSALGVLLAALFVAALSVGGQAMSVSEGLPFAIVLAIQGVFVVFVLAADRLARA